MSLEMIILWVAILHYLSLSLIFLSCQIYLRSLSKSVLLSLKSPKNKIAIEHDIKEFEKSSKLFVLWPIFLIKKLKDELINRK